MHAPSAGQQIGALRFNRKSRELAGSAPLAADGSFTFMDTPSIGPFVYRAVYTDRVTGLPYATLLHDPVASSPDLSTDAELWCGKC